jgi:DNA repair ATPase RecN
MSGEDYEVIPTSPIRRLEKRLEKMEDTTSSSQVQKLMEQVIELVKSNQRIIDDVVKANAELREELSKIPGKVDKLMDTMSDFMDLLRIASEEEERAGASGVGVGPEALKPLTDRLTELVEQNRKSLEANQTMITAMETIDKRLKRLYMGFANMYRR